MTKHPGYVRLSDGSIRRKDTAEHPRLSVADSDHHIPALEREPLDLDHTRKHRDEQRAAWAAARAAERGTRIG